MTDTVKPPSLSHMKRIERAAALAAVQLDEAESIVLSRAPSAKGADRVALVAAVLHAIALNYHAGATAPK